jgi:topoisomerase-4 subunit A
MMCYNKVVNIVGIRQYHPHGDASIGDAMVQIGQKDLLIGAGKTGEYPHW